MKNMNYTSLCIPRIESTINKEYVLSIFNKLDIGIISRIHEIPLRYNQDFKRIIISIKLNTTEKSLTVQKLINENKSVKVVHDMPWYWKVVKTESQQ
jgi:hypothetical protein